MYTDRNYSCFYGHSYVSETDGDEQHLVEFIYLTGCIYSQYLEKKPEKLLTIASYSEAQGQSVGEDGSILNYIVTEVYYLPESCVKELGLQKGKHAALILRQHTAVKSGKKGEIHLFAKILPSQSFRLPPSGLF